MTSTTLASAPPARAPASSAASTGGRPATARPATRSSWSRTAGTAGRPSRASCSPARAAPRRRRPWTLVARWWHRSRPASPSTPSDGSTRRRATPALDARQLPLTLADAPVHALGSRNVAAVTVHDVSKLVGELREAGKAKATARRVLQVLSLDVRRCSRAAPRAREPGSPRSPAVTDRRSGPTPARRPRSPSWTTRRREAGRLDARAAPPPLTVALSSGVARASYWPCAGRTWEGT